MRRTAVAALIFLVGGCGAQDSFSPPPGVAGTYTLQSVDASALPFVYLEAPGYREEILSGTVTLEPDGRFTDQTVYRRMRDGAVTNTTTAIHGSWSVRNDVVRFLPHEGTSPGRPYTMRYGGTRLTLLEAGLTIVFER